jgi:hypothetical protein
MHPEHPGRHADEKQILIGSQRLRRSKYRN